MFQLQSGSGCSADPKEHKDTVRELSADVNTKTNCDKLCVQCVGIDCSSLHAGEEDS